MLSGYTRLTYSLAILMMETTQSVNLFIPVFISIFISHLTGRMFNRSLYEYSIRAKQMPVLRNHLPRKNEHLRVRDVLRDLFDSRAGQELEVVESVTTVERLSDVLSSDRAFSTIPITNMYGCLIGLIPKSFVVVLIE